MRGHGSETHRGIWDAEIIAQHRTPFSAQAFAALAFLEEWKVEGVGPIRVQNAVAKGPLEYQ